MISVRKVGYISDGLTLRGTIFSPTMNKRSVLRPAMLIVHGWKGSERGYEGIARSIASLGVTVFTFNLRGHGNSDGKKHAGSRAEYVRDTRLAYRFLLQQPGVDRERIAAMSSSLGCHLISHALSHCPFVALAFRTPATYPDRGFQARFAPQVNNRLKEFRNRLLVPQDNLGLRRLKYFRGDLLIISGGQDQDVPRPTVANYLAAASQAVTVTDKVYSSMAHVPTPRQRGYINRFLLEWITRRLVQRSIAPPHRSTA